MPIEMKPVTSSWVAAIGHDPVASELHVHLADGRKYAWPNVTAAEHQALMSAPSIGAHLNAHIKPSRAPRRL